MKVNKKRRAPAYSRRRGMITVTFEAPTRLHAKLKALAKDDGRTLSAFCRRILEGIV